MALRFHSGPDPDGLPKFAERVTRSGRDLEDPNLADFKFEKLQEGVRRGLTAPRFKAIAPSETKAGNFGLTGNAAGLGID